MATDIQDLQAKRLGLSLPEHATRWAKQISGDFQHRPAVRAPLRAAVAAALM
jgi:hypothetical protein